MSRYRRRRSKPFSELSMLEMCAICGQLIFEDEADLERWEEEGTWTCKDQLWCADGMAMARQFKSYRRKQEKALAKGEPPPDWSKEFPDAYGYG